MHRAEEAPLGVEANAVRQKSLVIGLKPHLAVEEEVPVPATGVNGTRLLLKLND